MRFSEYIHVHVRTVETFLQQFILIDMLDQMILFFQKPGWWMLHVSATVKQPHIN